MQKPLTIPNNPVYPPSMDWAFLRKEGMNHIERLGSDVWTDYNLHDPGITILEVLCYALTDLGYRVNLPSGDIFSGSGTKEFYSAAEILPCKPVTALDLRKVLVDIDGVQNAWVEQLDEAEIRFFLNSPLETEQASKILAHYFGLVGFEGPIPVPVLDVALLKAIYECQSEKDKEDDRRVLKKSMLDSLLAIIILQPDSLKKALILYVIDTYWSELIYFLENEVTVDTTIDRSELRLLIKECHNIRERLKQNPFNYDWGTAAINVITTINGTTQIAKFFYGEPLLSLILPENVDTSAVPSDATPENYYNLFIPRGIYNVTLKLETDRSVDENAIIEAAKNLLHRNRNLCEDFHPAIRITETIKIGISLSLDIDPATNKFPLLAEVYYAIQQYLCPSIRFYSLEEMLNRFTVFTLTADALDELEGILIPMETITALRQLQDKEITGEVEFRNAIKALMDTTSFDEYYSYLFVQANKEYNADQVYLGPLLDHGFIDETELNAAQPRQTVYRSDLYQLIAAVNGVRQIEKLEIFKRDEPDEREGNWCLSFDCRCLPELDLDASEISIRKGSGFQDISIDALRDFLIEHPFPTTRILRKEMLDLPYPPTKVRKDLAEFTSVQEDFPRTYKIGRTGIQSSESAVRKAQSKQLQGYLLFYDQLLINYLTHLDSVKKMLSIGKMQSISYKPLYDTPGIQDLLLDFKPDEKNKSAWDDFIKDDQNPYIKILKTASEGNSVRSRLQKNKILDHLLARFGEVFTDYTIKLFPIDQPVDPSGLWEENEGLEEMIEDKQRFLDHLPLLSAGRAGAMNYHPANPEEPDFWNTMNVEGVKLRVSASLGIDNWTRHTITCEPAFIIQVGPVMIQAGSQYGRNKFEFFLKPAEQSNIRLLVSTAKFSSPEAAEAASADFLNMAVNKSNYDILKDKIIGFWPDIPAAERTAANALMIEPRENEENIEERLHHIRDMAAGNCQDDGFHLLEHILLRPRDESFTQLLHPMIACAGQLELMDPYSFWLSVILPAWTDRFKNEQGLIQFKESFRKECGAHIAIRFCLLDREQMFAFEKLYFRWLEVLCKRPPDNFAKATDELVALMNGWDENIIIL